MEVLQRKSVIAAIAGFIGLALGLFWAWVVDPVEWTGIRIKDIAEEDQLRYLTLVADVYANERNPQKVQEALAGWPNVDQTICQFAAQSTNPEMRGRLEALVFVRTGQGCTAVAQPAPGATTPTEEAGGGFGQVLLFGLIFLILLGAIVFALRRRSAAMGQAAPIGRTYGEMPVSAPVGSTIEEEGTTAVPIARFRTTYTRGHDAYDDSFSIENAYGDFLGECGVGISESIGSDLPKNVTAFEVWLFDKNDIRTITKVIMSDHAFFDDALRAKLQTKGEQVLAREGETVVLETASLIINAEITDMQYGTGTLPPKSYFETMTIELSAWQKEGAAVAAGANASDMLNY